VILTGCNKNKQSEDIPSLQLEYFKDNKTETMTIPRGTASWSFMSTGIEADAAHPLDSVGSIPEIVIEDDLSEIKINFSKPPTSYTVRAWTMEYVENSEAYDNFYEEVEITKDTFTVPNDEVGFIYLVHAIWPQGNVYYGFTVFNSEYIDIVKDNDKSSEDTENEKEHKVNEGITTPVLIQDIVIGGLNKGVWMEYEELYKSGAIYFDGFEYNLYSNSTKIGTAIGSQPKSWMSGEPLSEIEYIYEYCMVDLFDNGNKIDEYDIAIKADWDLFPRLFYEDNTEQDYYMNIVKEHLIEIGLENPETTVKQSIKVDLEGDGIDEVLIYADNKIEGSFDEVKKGDNAVVIFRKYTDGKAIDQLLDYYIIMEDPEYSTPYRMLYGVENVADLDGDGIMEIIVNQWYYEGFGWNIYKLIDNKLELVASNGLGA
jgi:hypothetical protein